MKIVFATTLMLLAGASAVGAQAQETIADLAAKGYEIKTMFGGGAAIILMQKDASIYGCLFPGSIRPDAINSGAIPASKIVCAPIK